MKRTVGILLILYLFIFSGGKVYSHGNLTRKNSNVLIITIDTLRLDRVGIYSDKYVKTPTIDSLATRSFVFRWAFAHNPVTLPSHVNIMTGTTPLFHGISDNPGFFLDKKFLTIADYLKAKGYNTGAFIAAYPLDSRFGLNQGFEIYDDHYGTQKVDSIYFVERPAERVIKPAIEWIKNREKKWFAWIHLFEPHEPYEPPPPYDTQFPKDPYSGEVACLDAKLKVLFDFLEERNLYKNTIIILTADHGEAFGEKGETSHSYFAYNNTIHIPLILNIPGTHGGWIEENVAHIDIFPTLCILLGYKIPGHLQGKSLVPLLRGKKLEERAIYFESLTPYLTRGWAPLRGYIEGSRKFIDLPIRELYDFKKDPGENNNLATPDNIGKYRSRLSMLQKELEGKDRVERFRKIDSREMKKLESLGYITSNFSGEKKIFTEKDDLKVLKPLQNKMEEAVKWFSNGKRCKAIEQMEMLVKQRTDFIIAFDYLAGFYRDSGNLKKAIEVLQKGLEHNKNNLNLKMKLGIYLIDDVSPEQGIPLLLEYEKRNPYNPDTVNYLGIAYQKMGNYDKALEFYNRAIKLDENLSAAYYNRGALYLAKCIKNYKKETCLKALEDFSKTLEIEPKHISALNGRAVAFRLMKNLRMAVEDWKKVIKIDPSYARAYIYIGECFFQMKKPAEAKKFLKLCREKYYLELNAKDRQKLDHLLKTTNN